MKYIIPLVALLMLCSCDDDDLRIEVDLNQFDQITERYPYQNLQPNTKVDYLEFIFSFRGLEEEEILFSSGQKCLNASNQGDCESEFDSIKNEVEGFNGGCRPLGCFRYVKYQRGDVIDFLNTANEIKTFLGDIDSESDAILLAFSENYYFSTENKEIGAIRKT